MAKKENVLVVPTANIINKIYYIREQKVMLDTDLADLYGVETRVLKQAVKRNIDRFPEDFMFELTDIENGELKTTFETLSRGQHSKYLSYVFTEQGVSMLSSILKSERAIKMNIQIMRTFTHIRSMLSNHMELRLEIEKIKGKLEKQDKNIELVFHYLDELLEQKSKPEPPRKSIGYKPDEE